MVTKIIIYLLIGIIVGSTLGFGGGYGIYSPQISNLSKKLNTTETKYAELLSSNQLLLNQKDELQIRYTNATNLVADLQNQLNDKDTQIINLQNKINQYINEQNILQSKILDLENKLQVILEGPELTIYPDNGTYPQPLEITMKSSIDGSMLYYTLDGSEPSTSSKKYEESIKINDIGEVTIKAIGVSLYRAGSIMTKKYTIVDSNPPLGEVGGLHYVTWNFNKNNFRKLDVTIKIYEEPSLGDGLYFQMYQGMINGVGFYFGFQTDVYKPGVGSAGKGIIFSRWGTNDLSNVRIVDGGWSQSAGYEGDFVGVRVNYVWSTHTYKMSVRYIRP